MGRALSYLISLGLIWGSGYSIARYAMTHGVPALGYAFWQTWGPALFLLLVLSYKRMGLSLNPRTMGFYLTTGALGIALPNTVMYIVAAHLPAGILAVVVNTSPIFTYILAWSFKQERFYWLRVLGVLSCMIGLLITTLPQAQLPAPHKTAWILLALISPLSFATCAIITSKFRPSELNSTNLSCGMLLSAGIIITPIVFWEGAFFPLTPPFHITHAIIVLEIALSSLGYIIFFELLRHAGPVYYSTVGGLVALTGLAWGQILFDERFPPLINIAVLCILLGIVCVSLKFKAYTQIEPANSISD